MRRTAAIVTTTVVLVLAGAFAAGSAPTTAERSVARHQCPART
jgi:hypothetical protein